MADSTGAGGESAGEIRAAGALLWRPAAGGPEIALIHRERYDDWTFPKGKALPGEHVVLTAAREVAEETGIRIVLGRRLPTVRYLSGGKPKRVDYWAGRPADGPDDDPQPGFVPNDEVDDLAWVPLPDARGRLTYGHDAQLLDEFAAGPALTAPAVILRHAWARNKNAWRAEGHPEDLGRPLTRHGQAQARDLAEILACFGPARVVSSAAERCLASVRPYAALAGAEVEAEPAFTVTDSEPVPDEARERVLALMAGGGSAVMCGHRENLPSLLAWTSQALHAAAPPGRPLPKGGFWVLHAAGGRLAAAERHQLSE
ncbi:MAG: NUDIX hydrolase [Gemmatimonadota bacterium]